MAAVQKSFFSAPGFALVLLLGFIGPFIWRNFFKDDVTLLISQSNSPDYYVIIAEVIFAVLYFAACFTVRAFLIALYDHIYSEERGNRTL